MKNDIDNLVSRMQNDDRSSRVISICGMGGLGKTTLARKIYQHKDILFCFEARAWVCITQKLQAKVILRQILRQLILPREDNDRPMGMEEDELVTEIYNILKDKKCLVVLDDIWEIDHWNILKKAFPLAESNSKILLTTRNQMIADTEFVHKLELLTEDESWDLLQKIALPIHQSQGLTTENSKNFEATGRELVRKCGYLPLAVAVVGGILRGQQSLGDWKKVLQNMDSHLKHGKGVNANDKRVEQILNLSYNVLPYYLKLCFLYLGCFPEDTEIDVEDVYLIWMAEGLISSDDKGRNETLRDVAERCLNELASKCMVQVKMTEFPKSFRLHDLVRDLCLSKGKEEKFFEDSQGKIRRLAFNWDDDNACTTLAKFKNANLRSLLLLCQGPYITTLSDDDMTNMCKKLLSNTLLRSLKVLVLEKWRFNDGKLPDAVRNLVMLKHLSVRGSNIKELPEFVCRLACLQSMDLRIRVYIKLPNSFGKMGRLRHLFLNAMGVKKIDGGRLRPLDGSMELETFIGFDSEIFDANHFPNLTNLRCFGGRVHDIESLSVVVEHITKLKDQFRERMLEILIWDLSSEEGSLVMDSLTHCPLNNLRIRGRLRRWPTWDPQCELFQNLTALEIELSAIGEDPMEKLHHLPTLRSLVLGWRSFTGTELVFRRAAFPQLERLTLYGLQNLVGWTVEEESMPNLSVLRVISCPKLEMIPAGIVSMSSMTSLSIQSMPESFISRLREGGEDYHKISHIPFIVLGVPPDSDSSAIFGTN